MTFEDELIDLKAKQAATDAVLTSLLAVLLAKNENASVILSAVRTDLNVQAKKKDGSDALTLQLQVEEYIQQLVDRIEKLLNS